MVLIDRLREAVARLNPTLPADAVQRVCEIAMTGTSPVPIENHRGFHELRLSGVPIAFVDDEGVERSDRAKLVDFEHPMCNELLVVNQLTIVVDENNRRPDILLFVNGLPLGQLELKAPGKAALRPGGSQSGPPLHRGDSRPLPLRGDRRRLRSNDRARRYCSSTPVGALRRVEGDGRRGGVGEATATAGDD